MRLKSLLISAFAITALVLSGCSGDDADSEATDNETSAETSTEASEPTEEATEEEDSGDAAEAGDATEAGAELELGEAATVLFPEPEQAIEVSVTDISEAPKKDFKAAGDDFMKKLEGFTPYYIKAEAKKLKPVTDELAGKGVDQHLRAFDSDDNRLSPIQMIGSFDACDETDFDEGDAGKTVSTCYIVAVQDGQEFGYAAWSPNDTEYDYSDGDPIKWMQ